MISVGWTTAMCWWCSSICIGELPEDCTETMQALVDVGAAESMDALRAKLTPLYKPDTYMDAAVGY
mgnify:CR=1 FL=1